MSLGPLERNNLIIASLGTLGFAASLKLTYSAVQQIGEFSQIKQLTHLETLRQKQFEVFKGLGGIALAAGSVKVAKWAIDQNNAEQKGLPLPALFLLGTLSFLAWLGEGLKDVKFEFLLGNSWEL